jgi:Uncharacterised nucleotidyltransferase
LLPALSPVQPASASGEWPQTCVFFLSKSPSSARELCKARWGLSFRYRGKVSELTVAQPVGSQPFGATAVGRQSLGQISGSCGDDRPSNAAKVNRNWSNSARRALLASVSTTARDKGGPSLGSLVANCDQDELVSLALAEGVAGPASLTLGPMLASAQHSRLITAVRQQTVRHLGHLAWLQRFGTALGEAEIDWLVLKGPVLAETCYQATTRGYADLDLMVPAWQLRRAVDTLRRAGAVVADQDWGFLLEIAKGELSMAVHGSPLIDLHWHLVYLGSARQRFLISTDELLERRQRIQLRGVDAWALEPTDFAIHVALHASSQGAHRLRRLLDIGRTLANQAPDWDVLVRRCRAWRVALPVGVLLNAAKQTVGADVPDEVLRDLASGPLERLMARQLASWVPSGRLPGSRSVKMGLSRSLRENLWATSIQFVGESWNALAAVVRDKRTGSFGQYRRPYINGPAGYERFIQMVEVADRYGHLSSRQHRRLLLGQPTAQSDL